MTKSASNISNRSNCVDIIKGWAMLTIIVFHCSSNLIRGEVSQLLGNPWNVPIFFILGGFFLKEDSLDKPKIFLEKKIKSLYIPATIIYGLNVLLHNVFVCIGWYPLGELHPATGVNFEYYGCRETVVGLLKVFAAAGSGELSMGAMWFLYSLLYAFVGIVILYMVINLVQKDIVKKFYYMTFTLLLIASISCILTQEYDMTISRFSTSATAMFLIWWGMIINQKLKWKYDNKWAFAIALVAFTHCAIMGSDDMVLARNRYQNLPFMIVGCTAAIYCWGYIGRLIENHWIGKFLALCGRDSLYLMAFHIIGFFMCNSFMVKLCVFSTDSPRGLYTYLLGDNGLLLLVYTFFGVAIPLVIMFVFRKIKRVFRYCPISSGYK